MNLYGLVCSRDGAEICGSMYYVPTVFFEGCRLHGKPICGIEFDKEYAIVSIKYHDTKVVYTGALEECSKYLEEELGNEVKEHSDFTHPYCFVMPASNVEIICYNPLTDLGVGICGDDIVWKIHNPKLHVDDYIFVMHNQEHVCYTFHEDLPDIVMRETLCVEELVSNRCVWGPEMENAKIWAENHVQYRLARRYLDLIETSSDTLDVDVSKCFGFTPLNELDKHICATVIFIDRESHTITVRYSGVQLMLSYEVGNDYIVGQEVTLKIF